MNEEGIRLGIPRARLIYNPTSGREEIKRKLPAILQRLERGGIEVSCHATECKGDATKAAAIAAERGYDIVISAGGDGTLNEIVNGLAGQAYRPTLGLLPLGTTNDFARAHGIPRHWEGAVDLITKNYSTPIDIGRANDAYFVNIAGGGSLTELTYEVPSKLKTMMGQLAYYMKGIEKVARLHPTRLKIKAEGAGEFEEDFMLFLIANSNSVAGFDRLLPDASTSDGKLDFIALRKCSLPEFFRIATLVMRGEHVLDDPHFLHFTSNRIEVEASGRMQLNLDGEFGGMLPCRFELLPAHLRMIVDERGESSYRKNGGPNRALLL